MSWASYLPWRHALPRITAFQAFLYVFALASGGALLLFEPRLARGIGVSFLGGLLMMSVLLGGRSVALIVSVIASLLALVFDIGPVAVASLAAFAIAGGELLRRGVSPLPITALMFAPSLFGQWHSHPDVFAAALLASVASAALAATSNVALATAVLMGIPRRSAALPTRTRISWTHIFFVMIAGSASLTTVALFAGSDRLLMSESTALRICVLVAVVLCLSHFVARRFAGQMELPVELARLFLSATRETRTGRRKLAANIQSLAATELAATQLREELQAARATLNHSAGELRDAGRLVASVRARYDVLMNISQDVTIFATSQGVIEATSASITELLGFEPAALRGKSLETLVPEACFLDHPFDLATLAGTSAVPLPTEAAVRTARGKDYKVTVVTCAFEIQKQRYYAVQLRDPARTSKALASFEEARSVTESARRSRDLFIATMSHELRTPLHGLLATLDLMRIDTDAPKEFQQRLSIARSSARSLLKIANDILDLTRIDSGHFTLERKLFGLPRLLDEIVQESRARANCAGLSLTATIRGELPPSFDGDPTRIKQILGNLVSNALKFTAHGGVSVVVAHDGTRVTIDVIDTGEGISADKREAIFDPFVQVDSMVGRVSGTGLGLPISRRLARAMQGELILLSSSRDGSTFRVSLPLAISADTPADEQSQRIFTNPRGRILVVEDNAANRYVAEALLESLECPATIVESGREALEQLETESFDLILMDCQMPGLDGYETTRRARRLLHTRVPIIAMTANAMAEDRKHCLDAGMDDFLPKPFGRAALSEVLCKWLVADGGERAAADETRPDRVSTVPSLDTEVFDELSQALQWRRESLQRICTTFISSAEQALPLLTATSDGDRRSLARHLHTLLGSSGMVGARQVEQIAGKLQGAFSGGRRDELAAGGASLKEAVQRFQLEFEKRLAEGRRAR